jgi:hypothetical protein
MKLGPKQPDPERGSAKTATESCSILLLLKTSGNPWAIQFAIVD